LYNYDETNVTDHPGSRTIICQRGLKRVERKIQHSKSAISIMYCIRGDGKYLPPMVVYKAQNLYSDWTSAGPTGAIYDVTASGWFDARCFSRWFNEILLPDAKQQNGTTVVIGDNLSSHFTLSVVQAACDNDIRFVSFVPNATHLLQPLDVGIFRSLKSEWRKILENWRRESRNKGTIPKTQFPGLLKRLQSHLKLENATSSFATCGIFPPDRQQVLKHVPQCNKDRSVGSEGESEIFTGAVADMLKKHCGNVKVNKDLFTTWTEIFVSTLPKHDACEGPLVLLRLGLSMVVYLLTESQW